MAKAEHDPARIATGEEEIPWNPNDAPRHQHKADRLAA
ncbi:hypothetical protein M2321_001396 [Rhodoblastus acidophilus]|nr:hypothetical protein [Rhodoblastus acidophilus]